MKLKSDQQKKKKHTWASSHVRHSDDPQITHFAAFSPFDENGEDWLLWLS